MVKKRTQQKILIEPPELPKETVIEVLPDGQLYELDSYKNLVLSNCKLTGASLIANSNKVGVQKSLTVLHLIYNKLFQKLKVSRLAILSISRAT
jgi:hypothetical protein